MIGVGPAKKMTTHMQTPPLLLKVTPGASAQAGEVPIQVLRDSFLITEQGANGLPASEINETTPSHRSLLARTACFT